MKKLLSLFIFIILVYSVYYDIKIGTLPTVSAVSVNRPIQQADAPVKKDPNQPEVKEVRVNAGDTVLTIVEQLHNGPIPVSIDQLIKDFTELNNGIKPESIQIGKVYSFPVYP
ncbi:hypothetical protein [Falsibacillus pallidus]|uniref:LysM domain-containing protein n=1 Tax=Falsibacillus pallidus TaxID=493781 RepID=A0A370GNH6_9BACI|nr:hypothetical protein [Falsibacillus pallidus]RDI43974.1 hypothetical protein DFR59_10336 [Falsibacillus pallidus]